MLSFILSIPCFVLLFVLLFEAFQKDEEVKNDLRKLFNLDSPVVRIFYVLVCVYAVVWLLGFLLPLSTVLAWISVVENLVAIVWFIQCLFSGLVSDWIFLLKMKFKSKSDK
ncbi:hypothetical protein A4_201 [Escherichia phage A4]|nr:hypothetical protein A4_201 [Escherichia phage A4]